MTELIWPGLLSGGTLLFGVAFFMTDRIHQGVVMSILSISNALLTLLAFTADETDVAFLSALSKGLLVNVAGFAAVFVMSMFNNTGTVIAGYLVTVFAHVMLLAFLFRLIPPSSLDTTRESTPPASELSPAPQGLSQYYFRDY